MVNPIARLPARIKMALATARSMPKMHWRWRRRGRDIVALLQSRFGSVLPDDDAGLDAAKLLAQHYIRLNIDAERVTRANLRLWAPWLTEKATAGIITAVKKAKTPSAARLARTFVSPPRRLSPSAWKPSARSRSRLKAPATDKLAAGEMAPLESVGVPRSISLPRKS
jgi:hypothetical protein